MSLRANRAGAARLLGISLGTMAVLAVVLVLALPAGQARKYPDRIPVRFWHMWTSEWKDVVERVVDRFNESQGRYEVIPLSVPATTADSKFLLSVAGGDPPDVMAQWNQVIPKWAESGLLIPLNELMSPGEWKTFQETAYPAAQKIGMYRGNLYAVTVGLDLYACYARVEHIREAGLDPARLPETLEELVRLGEKLQKRTPHGELTRIGFLPSDFAMFAPCFGPGFYDREQETLTINTPENLRALTFLVDQRRKLGFANVIRFEAGLNIGEGSVQWPFISGAYSITVDGQWRVEQLARFAPEIEYITFPIPPPKGGREHAGWTNGNFMIIPTGAKQVEGAWEFIKFWSGIDEPQRAAEFYAWGGWLPMSPAIAEAPKYQEFVKRNPQFRTFLDILPSENLQPAPPVPYQVYLWDRITQADDAAQRGSLTPEQALESLEKEMARELASRRAFGYDNDTVELSGR